MVRRHQHVEVDGHASAADDEGLSVSGFVANLAKETDFSEWSGADGEGERQKWDLQGLFWNSAVDGW